MAVSTCTVGPLPRMPVSAPLACGTGFLCLKTEIGGDMLYIKEDLERRGFRGRCEFLTMYLHLVRKKRLLIGKLC